MPNLIVKTMNVEEAADLMRQAGIRTSAERVRMGIQQGVYPWGDAVKMGTMSHIVYTKLFWKWMEERGDQAEPGPMPPRQGATQQTSGTASAVFGTDSPQASDQVEGDADALLEEEE